MHWIDIKYSWYLIVLGGEKKGLNNTNKNTMHDCLQINCTSPICSTSTYYVFVIHNSIMSMEVILISYCSFRELFVFINGHHLELQVEDCIRWVILPTSRWHCIQKTLLAVLIYWVDTLSLHTDSCLMWTRSLSACQFMANRWHDSRWKEFILFFLLWV